MHGMLVMGMQPSELVRFATPGEFVPWGQALWNKISKKNLILEHGSFASIPTVPHLKYVDAGFNSSRVADLRVIMIESASVIRGRKGENKFVLDDEVRTRLWNHVPGVDVSTITPSYNPNKIQVFWGAVYGQISKYANPEWMLMCSQGDRVSDEKELHARFSSTAVPWILFDGDWNQQYGGTGYSGWTTSEWDEVSGDHGEFERLARQYLVG